MPFAMEQLTQALSLQGVIAPQTQTQNTTQLSAAMDMSKFQRAMGVLVVGGTNTGSYVVKFQASATSGGTYADVPSTLATAVTTTGKQVTIEIRADQMPAGKQFLKLAITEGNVGSGLVCGVLLGGEAEYKPASAQDPATVVQRLVL